MHYFSYIIARITTFHTHACVSSRRNIELPPEVKTLSDPVNWLKTRGPEFEAAFAEIKSVRAAIDQTHANLDASIDGAKEIAFFPPVTGG